MPPLDFPSQVSTVQAPAVAGDFASTNPRSSVLSGPNGLVAGPAGASVALFAWLQYPDDQDGAPIQVNNFGPGAPDGFIHREQQALITAYLATSSNLVPAGFAITVFNEGDFWATNRGSVQALPGMKAYANNLNGQVLFAPPGQAPITASITGTITALTSSFTGYITDDVLTVTGIASGTMTLGQTLGTLGGVAANTRVAALGSGTGGTGTYIVSIPEQAVASGSAPATMSGSYGQLNCTAVASGTLGIGTLLSGTGAPLTSVVNITQMAANGTGIGLTGAGNTGTYNLSGPSTTMSSSAITGTNTTETKWFARSAGLVGEVVKMSAWPHG